MKHIYKRRITQITFFILIIYGGFILSQLFSMETYTPPYGTEQETNFVDATTPIRTCRYIQPEPNLFSSCSLKYMLEQPLNKNAWVVLSLQLLIFVALAFMFGRFMCGWMCPLGFVSDILDWLRKTLRIDRIKLSKKTRNVLKYWRYAWFLSLIFLSLAIVLPFISGAFMDKNFYQVVCQTCPARTILPLIAGQIPTAPSFFTRTTAIFSTISIVFIGIYITGLFVTRAWCRICPNGTLTGLFSKGSLLVKNKDVKKCTKCKICKRVCPFNNDHVFEEKEKTNINDPDCIMCFQCVDKCPEKDCLQVTFAGKKVMRSKMKKK